jgi:hypothetical protein
MLASRFARSVGRPREVKPRAELAILFLLLAPALANAAELKPETLQAWDAYVGAAKVRMEERARGQAPFLWVDEERDLARRVRAGEVLVEPVDSHSPHTVPRGLIHDWIGAVFVPKAKLDDVMGVLDDYERYKDFYRPMVVKAKLLEQTHDHEKVTLLMMQKAYSVTGAVETDNEIQIARVGADRVYSLSTSVRVQAIADYGQPSEHALPEDHGPGYVWRTFTVTRLEQGDGGVYVEMELIGLSRGIPLAFRWLIQPLAERLPRNMLVATLQDTRDAVSQEIKAASMKGPSASLAPSESAVAASSITAICLWIPSVELVSASCSAGSGSSTTPLFPERLPGFR